MSVSLTVRATSASGIASTATLKMLLFILIAGAAPSGCATPSLRKSLPEIAASDVPRELSKVSIPAYRVEPPDILLMEAVNNIRPANDGLRVGDELLIKAANLLPVDPDGDPVLEMTKVISDGPIGGGQFQTHMVQADGTVDLGPHYGSVPVEGLTVKQSRDEIERHLREVVGLEDPKVTVTMPNVSGKQVISGEHLVRPDGTISLGVYGSVHVAGMTLDEVKDAVEAHLSQFIHKPEINVDVLAYNSKSIYVVTDGGGFGEQVIKLPYTGSETVLDAIADIQGLSEVSSKKIWVARPAPNGMECAQNLLVDWRGITQDGVTTTNYQLLPGDRIYIQADGWVAFDNLVIRVTQPIGRIFGFTLLGNGTVRALQQSSGGNQGTGAGGGFFSVDSE
jgi:polysaccharide biosynthesis/export protein